MHYDTCSKEKASSIHVQPGVDSWQQMLMYTVQVFDPVEDYLKLLRTIFDFNALKALLRKPDFTFTFDGMHGVSGPYARRIFVEVALQPLNCGATCQHSTAVACTRPMTLAFQ